MAIKLTKAAARKIKAKWGSEDPLLHYVPAVTLARAGESKSRYICIHAPNQCLGGNTEIYDPVDKIARKVSEIDSPFHVYAWDEYNGQMVVAQALTPERLETDEIYIVTLSDGRRFEASLGHRLLCADGRWQPLSAIPPGCALYRPPSTLGNGQSIHVADGLRLTNTNQDSQSDYRHSRRLYDEQLQSAEGIGQEASPSPGDALLRTQVAMPPASAHADDPGYGLEYSHPRQSFDRLSSQDAQRHREALSAASSTHLDAPVASQCDDLPQTETQQCAAVSGPPQPSFASQEFDRPLAEFSACPPRLVSCVFVRTDYKYDFEVPQYNNYLVCGTLQHNCGKTAWMQYIVASVLRNRNINWVNARPIRVLLVIPTRAQAADVWGNRMLKASGLFGAMGKHPWIPAREIKRTYNSFSPAGPYPGKIVMKNGNELITILSGVPNSWKALEGITVDMVIRDEVAGTENLGDELQPRLLASRTRALAGMQPWGGVMIWSATETKYNEEWLLYKGRALDGQPDHVYFKPEPEEAEAYISMKAREEMRNSMSEKSYKIRGAGSLDAGDLVRIFVKQWDDKRHMQKTDYVIKDSDNIMIGWDPGTHHPTGIVIAAITQDAACQIKVVKCFRHTNESIEFDAERIHSFLLGRKIAGFVYDWAAKAAHKGQPSLLHLMIAALEAKGYVPLAGYIQADKRVEPGINSFRHYLDPNPFDSTVQPLFVVNSSQESGGQMLRSEIMGYCKTEPTGTSPGKIVKKNDDLCFAAQTMVRMADYSQKPIIDVIAGDMVATPIGPRKVIRSWMSNASAQVSTYTTEAGRSVTCTPGHRFLVNSNEWLPISTVSRRDTLSAWTEEAETLETDRVKSAAPQPPASVYDIEVDKAHCFYANDLLAHNCDPSRYLIRSFPSWSSAYSCGRPKFEVLVPMETAPTKLPVGVITQTMEEYRAALSRKLANRNRASVRKEFSYRPTYAIQ